MSELSLREELFRQAVGEVDEALGDGVPEVGVDGHSFGAEEMGVASGNRPSEVPELLLRELGVADVARVARSFAQAQSLKEEGAVYELEASQDGGAIAKVRGGGPGAAYSVHVRSLGPPAIPGEPPATDCTCPDFENRGGLCKHGATVLLALLPGSGYVAPSPSAVDGALLASSGGSSPPPPLPPPAEAPPPHLSSPQASPAVAISEPPSLSSLLPTSGAPPQAFKRRRLPASFTAPTPEPAPPASGGGGGRGGAGDRRSLGGRGGSAAPGAVAMEDRLDVFSDAGAGGALPSRTRERAAPSEASAILGGKPRPATAAQAFTRTTGAATGLRWKDLRIEERLPYEEAAAEERARWEAQQRWAEVAVSSDVAEEVSSRVGGASGQAWEVDLGRRGWQKLDDSTTANLQTAVQHGLIEIEYSARGQNYRVDLTGLFQENVKTCIRRALRPTVAPLREATSVLSGGLMEERTISGKPFALRGHADLGEVDRGTVRGGAGGASASSAPPRWTSAAPFSAAAAVPAAARPQGQQLQPASSQPPMSARCLGAQLDLLMFDDDSKEAPQQAGPEGATSQQAPAAIIPAAVRFATVAAETVASGPPPQGTTVSPMMAVRRESRGASSPPCAALAVASERTTGGLHQTSPPGAARAVASERPNSGLYQTSPPGATRAFAPERTTGGLHQPLLVDRSHVPPPASDRNQPLSSGGVHPPRPAGAALPNRPHVSLASPSSAESAKESQRPTAPPVGGPSASSSDAEACRRRVVSFFDRLMELD
jgi:hypothetical protein